jgi:hypothetical protein
LVNILHSMPRSCGFLRKRRGLYENIVNFKLAFLGELKLCSQANFIYLVSSQNSNSSPSTSDFSSCQWGFCSIDSLNVRCTSTWNWEHTCKNKYVFLQQLNSFYLSLAILLPIIMVNEKQEREVSSK